MALRAAIQNESQPPWDRPSAGRDRRKRRSHFGATFNDVIESRVLTARYHSRLCWVAMVEW